MMIEQTTTRRRITRPVVSDQDGTREGGLAFWIALICGVIIASLVHPLALASFWVWVALLAMAVGCGVSVWRLARCVTDAEGADG